MVKITIKKQDMTASGSEESEENESEGSDAESTGSSSRNSLNVSKTGRSKRKCVVNFEKKKKAKTLRPAKSRSKSVTPDDEDDDDEDDEEEEGQNIEEKHQKQIFSCEICSKAFHSKFMMRTHLKAHKKVEENSQCDKYYHYYLNSLN